MDVIIGEAQAKIDLPEEGVTLEQLVNEVESYLFSLGLIPNTLNIDGEELTQEGLESRLGEALSGEETLRFGVIKIIQFVLENLEGVEPANESLLKNIRAFAEQVYSNEQTSDSEELTTELTHFFDFWLKMRGLLPEHFSSLEVEGKSLDEVLDGMHHLLKEVMEAMEGGDFVLAADLLQYEIVPSVEQVSEGIPLLRTAILEKEVEGEASPTVMS